MSIFDLHGRRALVVGGGGDLGSAITRALAEAGAAVVAVDIDPQVETLAESLRAMGRLACGLRVDVRDREAVASSVRTAEAALDGSIDILVNAAGIQRRHPSEEFPDNDWDDVLMVNLTATFLYCRAVAKGMLAKGYGKIINIASLMSQFGGITIPAYAASKGGVAQLTKALSNDWAGRGICVNAIAPGYIDTRLNTALIHDQRRSAEVLLRTPTNRWGLPADVAGAAVFLASSASDFITGVVLPVDGGYSAR